MTIDEVVPALRRACPSAEPDWEEHLQFWGGAERGLYNDVGVFADHAVRKYGLGEVEELPALFTVVEQMVAAEDSRVRDLGVVGLIETIQNIASHRPHGFAVFLPWLGPRSSEAWRAVDEAWSGVGSLAEIIRRETRSGG
jgi:hypothetical protein